MTPAAQAAADLIRSGQLVPATLPHRTDGPAFAIAVRGALSAIGLRLTVERRGPRLVLIHLPPAWPVEWDLAPVLRTVGAEIGAEVHHAYGSTLRVRKVGQ